MPASFRMATLLPLCAMRVRRVALPLREEEKVEKVSFYFPVSLFVGDGVEEPRTVLSRTRWSRALS